MLKRPLTMLAVVMLAALGSLTTTPATAAGTPTDGLAHVHGRIVGEDGEPLGFAEAVLYLRMPGGQLAMVAFEHANDDGWYDLSVVPGRYIVWFTPVGLHPLGTYFDEYYPNTHDPTAAREINFRADTTTRVSARLDRASTISGTLTVTGSIPPSQFTPVAYDAHTGASEAGWVNEDGTYEITGLPHGSYVVYVTYYDEETDILILRYWPDSHTIHGARNVLIPRARNVTGIDITVT
jgi:hypothetical protein